MTGYSPDGGFQTFPLVDSQATDDDCKEHQFNCWHELRIFIFSVVPGPPSDLVVVDVTQSTVTVSWNPPLENPQCANKYDTQFIDLDDIYSQQTVSNTKIYSIMNR